MHCFKGKTREKKVCIVCLLNYLVKLIKESITPRFNMRPVKPTNHTAGINVHLWYIALAIAIGMLKHILNFTGCEAYVAR